MQYQKLKSKSPSRVPIRRCWFPFYTALSQTLAETVKQEVRQWNLEADMIYTHKYLTLKGPDLLGNTKKKQIIKCFLILVQCQIENDILLKWHCQLHHALWNLCSKLNFGDSSALEPKCHIQVDSDLDLCPFNNVNPQYTEELCPPSFKICLPVMADFMPRQSTLFI